MVKANRSKVLAAAIAATLATAGVGLTAVDVTANTDVGSASNAARYALPDFTDIVERVGPAVVSIHVSKTTPTQFSSGPRGGWNQNDPMFEFFRRFGAPMEEGPRVAQGQGAGFIISDDGVVLTNAHVVDGADRVIVKLQDKRELEAKVVGMDKLTDIAVLRVEGHDLPTLKVGDSTRLKIGEWVLAVGSPFGFENSVTAGIVSAKTRTLPDGSTVPFIQTDVAINPGNSGGPLLNLDGEVVGINSQIYSNSGGYMGLSFAVPINVALNVQDQLVHYGKVTRGRLGVMVQTMTGDLASSFGLDRPEGALVSQVQDDSPAAKAGLKAGDIIMEVDGQPISDSAHVARIVADHKPGSEVKLAILREGKRQTLTANVTAADDATVADNDSGDNNVTGGRLGVVVEELNDEARRELGVSHGAYVERTGGAAADAGIRPGDVILSVNAAQVDGPADLKRLIDKAGDSVALLVRRGDVEIYVPVKLS
ncbi:MAG: DegQ family serine endoprotease [Gammaproteobacteria bacterium]|nr:DegQ family serine endoprotease [Gammaproteobacteria bacterium]